MMVANFFPRERGILTEISRLFIPFGGPTSLPTRADFMAKSTPASRGI